MSWFTGRHVLGRVKGYQLAVLLLPGLRRCNRLESFPDGEAATVSRTEPGSRSIGDRGELEGGNQPFCWVWRRVSEVADAQAPGGDLSGQPALQRSAPQVAGSGDEHGRAGQVSAKARGQQEHPPRDDQGAVEQGPGRHLPVGQFLLDAVRGPTPVAASASCRRCRCKTTSRHRRPHPDQSARSRQHVNFQNRQKSHQNQ